MSKAKTVPQRTIAKWKQSYSVADPIQRIRNTHDISCEAQSLEADYGKESVIAALRAVVNGDRSSAARLARVADILKSTINRIERKLRTAANKRTQAFNGSKMDARGTRSPSNQRIRRAAGFSQTHLLILTNVADTKQQATICEQSLSKQWTGAQLRAAINQVPGRNVVVRPLNLAHAVCTQVIELQALLAKVVEQALEQAVSKTKPGDRKAAIVECDQAVRLLREIGERARLAAKTFANSSKALAKLQGGSVAK